MLNGELVFNDELREMMLRVTERELEAKEKEKAEEDFVDVSRTGGTGAIGEWSSRPSGGSSKMPGGPVSKSRQMKIVRRRKKK